MNLRFLIDMNLSPAWAESFAHEGWEAVHWSTVGEPTARDQVVMDYARDGAWIVFTHDLDLGALLATSRAGGPSVIQVRTQDVTPQHLGPLVFGAIRAHAPALRAGVLLTIDEATARIRILPIV
jgi:predicted nuclease of predicted toxin-antitoxin system